ncbi:hypothetical protein TNCV_3976551 [Trichonephila clavipes]|nr:hypothetical protein TNCV_3976551 [Trichonephila clavipes]
MHVLLAKDQETLLSKEEYCRTHNLLQVPIAELAERWTELPQVSEGCVCCQGSKKSERVHGVAIVEKLTHAQIASQVPARIVRVQYFVRGGFVGHRFRESSKHLCSHLPVDGVRFLGGQKGLRCSCKMHLWVSGSLKISTAAGSGYVTALALSYRTFLLRKV